MNARPTLRLGPTPHFRRLVGVGGIGGGMFFALEGNRTLGRNESRPGRLLDVRDYCKLHIVAHHVAVLCGADPSGDPFHVVPVGTVGADESGRRLAAEMAAVGMDVSHVREMPDRPTLFSVCFQYPDGSGGNVTSVDSAASALEEADLEHAAAPLLGPDAIALAVPEVGLGVRRRLLELATDRGAFRVAALTSSEVPRARADGLLGLVDLLALNEDEAERLTGRRPDPDDPEPFLEALAVTLEAERARTSLIVTTGARGAFAFEEGSWAARRPPTVEVRSTAGAGDALLGGVLAGLAAGVPLLTAPEPNALSSALDLGVALAALAVTSPHTIHPSADLGALLAATREWGLSFRPPLADVVP